MLLQCLLIRGSHLLNYAACSPLASESGHSFHSHKGDCGKDLRAFLGTGPRAQVSLARAFSDPRGKRWSSRGRACFHGLDEVWGRVRFPFAAEAPALSTGAEAGTGFFQIPFKWDQMEAEANSGSPEDSWALIQRPVSKPFFFFLLLEQNVRDGSEWPFCFYHFLELLEPKLFNISKCHVWEQCILNPNNYLAWNSINLSFTSFLHPFVHTEAQKKELGVRGNWKSQTFGRGANKYNKHVRK